MRVSTAAPGPADSVPAGGPADRLGTADPNADAPSLACDWRALVLQPMVEHGRQALELMLPAPIAQRARAGGRIIAAEGLEG